MWTKNTFKSADFENHDVLIYMWFTLTLNVTCVGSVSVGLESKSHSLEFLCSPNPRKRLLRRLPKKVHSCFSVAGDFCVFKFPWRSVDERHLMCFRSGKICVLKFFRLSVDGESINVFKSLLNYFLHRSLLCTSGLGRQEDHKWSVFCFFVLQPSLGTLAWKTESPLVMERATS